MKKLENLVKGFFGFCFLIAFATGALHPGDVTPPAPDLSNSIIVSPNVDYASMEKESTKRTRELLRKHDSRKTIHNYKNFQHTKSNGYHSLENNSQNQKRETLELGPGEDCSNLSRDDLKYY